MREGIFYTCDDCKVEKAVFRSYKKARAASWALAQDYKTCYCPTCAPVHRLGGANGKRTTSARSWLPEGFEQLSIDVK